MPVPTVTMETMNHNNGNHIHNNHVVNNEIATATLAGFERGSGPREIQRSSENTIMVQVNPGEIFTIQCEDGSYNYFPGPAKVPMVSQNGAIPPIYVPPGYVSQVIEENGVRTVVVLPSGFPAEQGVFITPPHPMHVIHPSTMGMHPMFSPSLEARPDTSVHYFQRPMFNQEENNRTTDPSNPSQSPSETNNNPTSPKKNSRDPGSSVTSSPASNSSFVPSLTPSPESQPLLSNGKSDDKDYTFSMQHLSKTKSVTDARNSVNLIELLSSIKKPQVVDVESNSAKVIWGPLERTNDDFPNFDISSVLFQLHLCNRKKDGSNYNPVYSGEAKEYLLKELKPGTDYSVRICPYFKQQRGVSDVTNFHTLSTSPDTPTPPKLANRTKNSMLLKWPAPNDNGEKITKYHLEWNEGKNGGFKSLFASPQRQYKANKLAPAHIYAFRLAAENKIGKSDWSPEVRFQTQDTVPASPEAPRLTKSSPKSLSLMWVSPGGEILGFTLEMNDEASGYGFRPVYDGPETKCNVKGLSRSTHYKFRVCAYNKEGNSKWSEGRSYVTCPDKPQPPGKPLVKGGVRPREFRIQWNAPKDNGGSEVSDFMVEMSRERGNPMEIVYSGLERECPVEGLEPGHTYRLRVFCKTAGGCSLPSEVTMVTTLPVPPGRCRIPVLALRPKPNCVTVKWDSPDYNGGATISHYDVTCSHDDITKEVYQGQDRECTVGGLSPGRDYSFKVRAANSAGAGPYSDPLQVVTGAGTPEKPDPPLPSDVTPTSLKLNWNEPFGNGAPVTGYRLHWGGVETAMSVSNFGAQTCHHFTRLAPDTSYYFNIQAVNASGQSPLSDVGHVTTPPSHPSIVPNLREFVPASDQSDCEGVSDVITASSASVQWDSPKDNGAEISCYRLRLSERSKRSVDDDDIIEVDGDVTFYCIRDLKPDKDYKIQVCAVNSIGCGDLCPPLTFHTRPLPPDPPHLECIHSNFNSLKLKWSDKTQSGVQYLLQTRDKNGSRFQTIYRGSSCSYRVTKLLESATYRFRINASNSEGEGHFSQLYYFNTTPQSPPIMDAPQISQVQSTSCFVTWSKVEPIRGDPIQFRLSLEKTDGSLKQDFDCSETRHHVTGLRPRSEYRLRLRSLRHVAGRRHDNHSSGESTSSNDNLLEDDDDDDVTTELQSAPSGYAFLVTSSSPSDGGDDDDVTSEVRVVALSELSEPMTSSSLPSSHDHAANDEVTSSHPPESLERDEMTQAMSDDKKAAVMLAAYLLAAIFLAFAAQFVFVE